MRVWRPKYSEAVKPFRLTWIEDVIWVEESSSPLRIQEGCLGMPDEGPSTCLQGEATQSWPNRLEAVPGNPDLHIRITSRFASEFYCVLF